MQLQTIIYDVEADKNDAAQTVKSGSVEDSFPRGSHT